MAWGLGEDREPGGNSETEESRRGEKASLISRVQFPGTALAPGLRERPARLEGAGSERGGGLCVPVADGPVPCPRGQFTSAFRSPPRPSYGSFSSEQA